MIKVIYYREKCIGCSSCSDIASERWEIDEVDGKCNLLGSENKRNNIFILNTTEDEYISLTEVSDSCPVGIIEVKA